MKVVSNSAISLDGRLNTREGAFTLLGSRHDHARMSELRAWADAVLVGGATFRNWPHPALPDEPDRPKLQGRPWNVVVTRSMQVPLDTDWLREPAIRPLLLTSAAVARPVAGAEVEGFGSPLAECRDSARLAGKPQATTDLPVPWILDCLKRRGVQRLLVEAGGDLLFQFLEADALDEIYATLCPWVIGGPSPSLAAGAGFDAATMRRLRLLECTPVGDELFLRYAVVRQRTSATLPPAV